MENASKALIIAGAILLAILLISLGIMIFNQAQDVVNGSGMSQAELQAFNSKFTKYEGDRRGSVVRSLLQEAIASNADQANIDAGRFIKIAEVSNVTAEASTGTVLVNYVAGTTPTITSNTGTIKNTATYTITMKKYTNGRISEITIYKKP